MAKLRSRGRSLTPALQAQSRRHHGIESCPISGAIAFTWKNAGKRGIGHPHGSLTPEGRGQVRGTADAPGWSRFKMSGFQQRPMFSRSASGLEVALLIVMTFGSARAQTPTGTIAGSLADQSGAAVAGGAISVTNLATGQARSALTSAEGRYTVEALLPASYQVVVEVSGFKRLVRLVNVEAGTTTTVNLELEVGEVSEVTTAVGATPLLHHDHHQVGGVVGRAQIEDLPLNGRNFLELAKLEPGVTSPGRLTDDRMFVVVARRRAPLHSARRIHPGDGGWREHHHARDGRRAPSSVPGGRAGVPDRHGQLRCVDQPDEQRRHQHRDPLGRQRLSRAAGSTSTATTTWLPILVCGVTRTIPTRSSGGRSSVRTPAAPICARTGPSSSPATSAATSAVSARSSRGATEFEPARRHLPESLYGQPVQCARRRAPLPQPHGLRALHA